MLRNLIGAAIGRRIAGRNNGAGGALLGAAAPWIARRAFGPLGFAVAGAWGAKKLYDRRRRGRVAPTV
ncbi:MAG: hypothetical protein QOI38_2158 [Sphingomonadales bacterium]|jgi:hypothetical protein|nr:hypothetical protein [Sphingomonadales bacterium]